MPDSNPKPESLDLSAGDRVGAYRIERKIGSGGMADVFYAMHEGLHRPAAIKVLRASLATDKIHLQRFMQEARAAAALVHPNIVQVYDVGQSSEHQYIAQEFVAGSNLRQYLSLQDLPGKAVANESQDASQNAGKLDGSATVELQGLTSVGQSPIPSSGEARVPRDRQLGLPETLSILLQILSALSKSASSGIVHRDIKPENIMLTSDGDVKVADFGLARILLGDDPQLTRAGTTLGTPMYMSPEQIQEGQVDIRSDLYSLGVTLYHMLAGRPPFLGDTPLALAMKHVQTPLPDIREFRRDIPESMRKLLGRLLEKLPQDRFATPDKAMEFLRQARHQDLATIWPDQTVPLPGLNHQRQSGPLQATLMLQSKLRKRRQASRYKWLARGAVGLVLITMFTLGLVLTFKRPYNFFEDSPTDVYTSIPMLETVQKQYQAALLSTDLNPKAKWEAVEYYFKKDASELNRIYAGMASIQLARKHQAMLDYQAAKDSLKPTLNDSAMPENLKALAHLQIAIGAEETGNDEEMRAEVDKAVEIVRNQELSPYDVDQLNSLVESMTTKISKRWFASLSR